jgi:inorganic pyrophosphatase
LTHDHGQVLGVLCMIDEGEADWKTIVIDREDEWCP